MTFIQAFLLGAVEGLTEFLPVSSTGHLILASSIFGVPTSEFLKTFEIAIQLGAILAVVFLYRHLVFGDREVMKRVLFAFVPTGVVGLLLYKLVKTYLLGNVLVVITSLFLGGVFLIVFEVWHRARTARTTALGAVTYREALLLGLSQSVALVPGVSRSAATSVGGMILGLDRKTAIEFSFLLAIPTMLAATTLDLFKVGFSFTEHEVGALAIGFVTAFIVALAAIRFVLEHLQVNTFIPFGVYRICAAIAAFALLIK